jgi:beta-N-acetylhexosaminidase
LEDPLEHTSLLKMDLSTEAFFFHGLNPSDAERKAAMHAAEKADVIVICSYNAWKNPAAADLTESLLAMGRPVALLAVRDPLDAVLFSSADLIFTSFSPTLPSLQAICDELVKR